MSTINDGGPAFPRPAVFTATQGLASPEKDGMSLRDYMAIHASADDLRAQAEIIRSTQISAGGMGILPENWAITARYMHADAMLKARKEGGAA